MRAIALQTLRRKPSRYAVSGHLRAKRLGSGQDYERHRQGLVLPGFLHAGGAHLGSKMVSKAACILCRQSLNRLSAWSCL